MRKTCLNMVYELAKRDPRIVFIGSDLGAGTLEAVQGPRCRSGFSWKA